MVISQHLSFNKKSIYPCFRYLRQRGKTVAFAAINFYNRKSLSMASENSLRIDKWLWAARFYKTRSMAAKAVAGGRVQLNGVRTKPSKTVKIGDTLRLRKGEYEFIIVIEGLVSQRRPASEARTLYQETEESMAARALRSEQRKLESPGRRISSGKPSKRDRRLIRSFFKKDE